MDKIISAFESFMPKKEALYNGIKTWLVMKGCLPAFLPYLNDIKRRYILERFLLSEQFAKLIAGKAHVVLIQHGNYGALLLVGNKLSVKNAQYLDQIIAINRAMKQTFTLKDYFAIGQLLAYGTSNQRILINKRVLEVSITAQYKNHSIDIFGYWDKPKSKKAIEIAKKRYNKIVQCCPSCKFELLFREYIA